MRSAFGHIKKTENGYRCYWSDSGKRHTKRFHNIEDARKFLAQKCLENGHVDSAITVKKYYDTAVHPSFNRLAKKTKYEYERTWVNIAPYIGKEKISELNRRSIQSLIDKFDTPGGQRRAFVLMSKICNMAVADDVIPKSPVNRYIKRDKETYNKKTLYNTSTLKAALKAAMGTEFAVPLLLCCCGGMRPEEAFAVNHRDLDFDHNGYVFINVDKAITTVAGKKVLKDTKTKTSNRLVSISGGLAQYLIDHNKRIRNYRTLSEYPVPYNVSKRWRKFCEKKNLPYVRIGDMRSVYATLCAEAGCLDSVVCQAMGHSGRSMKERNYQSLTLQTMMRNSDCLCKYIGWN